MGSLSELRDRLRSITLTPGAERGFDDTRRRSPERPPRSERRIELAFAGAFLAAAVALLLAAGEGSGQLAVYRVDAASGRLMRLHTYPVGRSLSWVMTVKPATE